MAAVCFFSETGSSYNSAVNWAIFAICGTLRDPERPRRLAPSSWKLEVDTLYTVTATILTIRNTPLVVDFPKLKAFRILDAHEIDNFPLLSSFQNRNVFSRRLCQCPEWSLLTGKYNSFVFRKLIIFINKRWNMYTTVNSILTVHRIYLSLTTAVSVSDCRTPRPHANI